MKKPRSRVNDAHDAYVAPTREEVEAMREIIAHAILMFAVCPADDDLTQRYETAVGMFKASVKRLHDIEVANGRVSPLASTGLGGGA